jgi:hypothetical protein
MPKSRYRKTFFEKRYYPKEFLKFSETTLSCERIRRKINTKAKGHKGTKKKRTHFDRRRIMVNEIGSLYWAITHNCNSACPHCYMDCGPEGESLTFDEAVEVIENLPRRINFNIVLSGGEVLSPKSRELLFFVTSGLLSKYGRRPLAIQTNGDFLDSETVNDCLAAGITHISVASLDRYHGGGFASVEEKELHFRRLLEEEGFVELPGIKKLSPSRAEWSGRISQLLRMFAPEIEMRPNFALWGATDDLWLLGNWTRGRAISGGLALEAAGHNFCNMWSGGLNFLEAGSPRQEVSVQLSYLYPCCPTTVVAFADLREEPLIRGLERAGRQHIFRAINQGKPWLGADQFGVAPARARWMWKKTKNVCTICDALLSELDHADFPESPFHVYTQ